MSEPARDLRMTVPEFLRWDDGTETRYELVGGRPVAMAPAKDSARQRSPGNAGARSTGGWPTGRPVVRS